MAALTSAQQASYQRRRLATLKSQVIEMSSAWGDMDGYLESRLDGLATEIDRVEKEMVEFIAEEKEKSKEIL